MRDGEAVYRKGTAWEVRTATPPLPAAILTRAYGCRMIGGARRTAQAKEGRVGGSQGGRTPKRFHPIASQPSKTKCRWPPPGSQRDGAPSPRLDDPVGADTSLIRWGTMCVSRVFLCKDDALNRERICPQGRPTGRARGRRSGAGTSFRGRSGASR